MKKIFAQRQSRGAPRDARWVLLGVAVLLGCAARSPAHPLPASPPAVASGVQVFLLWSAPVDLDLYVTDPSLETVYFGNPVSGTGGLLKRDVTCESLDRGAADQPQVEEVSWDSPSPGRYRVGVDLIDTCGRKIEEAEFRVVTDVAGNRREQQGTVRKARFQPMVIEFDVSQK